MSPALSSFVRSFSTSVSKVHIHVTRPAKDAVRESPTPIAYFGASDEALVRSLRSSFSAQGFAFAQVRIPWQERANNIPAGGTVDDEVEAVHDAIRAANLSMPPVAIAPAHHAVFVQKYLESYPVSALVALAPLPPSPRRLLLRWTEQDRAEAWPGPLSATQLREALMRHLGPSSAQLLHDMHLLQLLSLESNAVNLEPQPVPMLVVSPSTELLPGAHTSTDTARGQGPAEKGTGRGLYRAEDVAETLQQHELETDDEQQVHWLRSCRTQRDAHDSVRLLWGESKHHLQGMSDSEDDNADRDIQTVNEVTKKLVDWVQARF